MGFNLAPDTCSKTPNFLWKSGNLGILQFSCHPQPTIHAHVSYHLHNICAHQHCDTGAHSLGCPSPWIRELLAVTNGSKRSLGQKLGHSKKFNFSTNCSSHLMHVIASISTSYVGTNTEIKTPIFLGPPLTVLWSY